MATQAPIPLIAPRSTEMRLEHFDESVYKASPSTLLYKFVDALCGTAGAGALVNEALLARMGAALDTIYHNELDFIFGKLSFLSRSPAESYPWNPSVDMLTSDQWDEVRVKDAWFRERIREFFSAVTKGSTPDGIRACVHAAIGVDADVHENWRYLDNYGLNVDQGRAETTARNEIVVRPHKEELSPVEMRLLRDMLAKVVSIDTIVTVTTQGLGSSIPVPMAAIAADSTYFEVQKVVLSTPAIAQLPAPELLPFDLLSTEQWMFSQDPTLAPYASFNMTQEYGYYYLVGGGSRSPIDSVTYGTLQDDGSVRAESSFETFENTGLFTPWKGYEEADSPDNYPGGRRGVHPGRAPAINPDGTPYIYPYASQQAYIEAKQAEVIAAGGEADQFRYRLPITPTVSTRRPHLAEYAVAAEAPTRDSTVSMSLTAPRGTNLPSVNPGDPGIFVAPTS